MKIKINNKNINNKTKNEETPVRKRRRKLNDEQIQAQIDKSIEIVNEYNKINEETRKRRAGKSINEYREDVNNENKKLKFKFSIGKNLKIISFALIFGIVIYLFFRYASTIGITINKNVDINDVVSFGITSTSSDDIYKKYMNELLIYNDQVLKTYDKNGRMTWQYKLEEKFNPTIYVEGKYMAVCNNSNGSIYFFNNKKEVYNKKIDGSIEKSYIDGNGNVAIEYSTNGYKKIVGVYDSSGSHLYNAYLSAEPIVELELLNNANEILVITSNTSSFKVGLDISVIKVNNGEATNENIATIDNNFLYDYKINGRIVTLLLSDSIATIDINSKSLNVIKEFTASQLLFISLQNKYFNLVEKSNEENGYLYTTFDYKSKIIGQTSIENVPKTYKSDGLITFVVYQNKIEVYNKWGINIKNLSIDFPPKDIITLRDGRTAALIYAGKVYMFNI